MRGDTLTAGQTVETYLLYRAAETTLQRGFDYFVVTAATVEQDSRYKGLGGGRPRASQARLFAKSRATTPWPTS